MSSVNSFSSSEFHCVGLVSVYFCRREETFCEALELGKLFVIEHFLQKGMSPSQLYKGLTPLYIASKHGHIEIVKLLLDHGASPLERNDLSQVSAFDRNWEANDLDSEHLARPLQIAIKTGRLEIVKLLHERGAPIDEEEELDWTPLFLAVHARCEEIALYFIEQGVRLNIRDDEEDSLIMMAIRSDLLKVVEELVAKGVSLADVNEEGETCVFIAAGRDEPDMLDFILKHGGNEMIDLRSSGDTPLSWAVKCAKIENVKLLVEAGADVHLTYQGLNLLELAKDCYQNELDFYRESGGFMREEDQLLRDKKSVVRFVKELLRALEGESFSMEKQRLAPSIAMDRTILFFIEKAFDAAGEGLLFLLCDLRDKANREDDWLPVRNPYCNTFSLMKAYHLIDGKGRMRSHAKNMIKKCIVQEGKCIQFKMPASLSKTAEERVNFCSCS